MVVNARISLCMYSETGWNAPAETSNSGCSQLGRSRKKVVSHHTHALSMLFSLLNDKCVQDDDDDDDDYHQAPLNFVYICIWTLLQDTTCFHAQWQQVSQNFMQKSISTNVWVTHFQNVKDNLSMRRAENGSTDNNWKMMRTNVLTKCFNVFCSLITRMVDIRLFASLTAHTDILT